MAAIAIVVPVLAYGQVVPSLTTSELRRLRGLPGIAIPLPHTVAPTTPPDCDALYLTDPTSEFPDGIGASKGYELIASCAEDLVSTIHDLSKEPEPALHNRYLIQVRVNFKMLRRWAGKRRPAVPGVGQRRALTALAALDTTLEDALRARGLFAQFSASLMTGPSFTDTQKDDKGEDKTKVLALGAVNWETRHFGDISLDPVDVSFGGRLGVQPVLTVVTPRDVAEVAALTGTQQSAFVWTFDGNLHLQQKAINAEYGLFVRTGAAMLTSVPSLVDRDRASFVTLPVDNGTGKTAWLWEAGVQFTMFDNRLAQVHAEKGTTAPQFQIGVAWRHDRRFVQAGSLADFRRPEQRLVFRMTIDALQVIDKRAFGQESKAFTLGFSVEHERDFFATGQTVPSATRYLLRGDLNLLKGFTSTDLPKTRATAADTGAPATSPKL